MDQDYQYFWIVNVSQFEMNQVLQCTRITNEYQQMMITHGSWIPIDQDCCLKQDQRTLKNWITVLSHNNRGLAMDYQLSE